MGESPPPSDLRAARALRTQRLLLWGLIAAAVVLLAGLTAGFIWRERAQEVEAAAEQAQRHADRLARDLSRTLALADLAIEQDLRHRAAQAEAPAAAETTDRAELLGALLLPFSLQPEAGEASAAGAGPAWQALSPGQAGATAADPLAISIRRAAGANALGIAGHVARLSMAGLVERFDHVRTAALGGVALFRADADGRSVTLLARAPLDAGVLGKQFHGPLVQALRAAPRGWFDDLTQIDGQRRIVGYSRVDRSDLVVGYGLAHGAVLAHWRAGLAPAGAAAVALIALLLVGGWWLDRSLRAAAERALALYRSDAQFRALADNLPDVLVRFGRDHRYMYANPGIEVATGRRPEDLIGHTNAELGMPAENVALWDASLDRVFASAQAIRMEFSFPGPSGLRDWESLTVPVPGPAGPADTALTISRDVTERRRAEDALRRSELRFRLAASFGQVWDWDIPSNRLDVPAQFWRALGRQAPSASTAIHTITEAMDPRDRPAWRAATRAHLVSREPFDLTSRFITASGELRWIHTRGQAVWGADGRALYMAGTAFDVTTRHRLEDAVRVNEARLQDLLVNSPAVIYTLDAHPDHPVTYCSDNVSGLLGYEAAEITGDRAFWHSHLHPDDAPRARAHTDLAASRGDGVFEYRFRHRDGHWVWIRDHMRLLRDAAGRPKQFIGSVIDISARREAEQEVRRLNTDLETRVRERTAALDNSLARLRQVNGDLTATNRELEAFTYSVSHDLRAPLRAIDALTALLSQQEGAALSEEGVGLLERVRASAKRMDTLIHDLLLFARSAREPIHRTQVPMSALVRHCLDEHRAEIGARRIEIVLADLPCAYADPGLLRQVLANLLGNAIKYTRQQAAARIEVGMLPDAAEPTYFVRDNGAGFDMAQAAGLFKVFQRLHAASEFEGTGVGLAIVQRIIERHGGRVWAEAAPQAGATFYFTIGVDI